MRLETLMLNHLDLEVFPEELLGLTALTSLELARNRMRSISADVSRLTGLQVGARAPS